MPRLRTGDDDDDRTLRLRVPVEYDGERADLRAVLEAILADAVAESKEDTTVTMAPPSEPTGGDPGARKRQIDRIAVIDEFNTSSLTVAKSLAKEDVSVGKVRTALLFTLAGLTGISGLVFVGCAIFASKNPLGLGASGVTFLTALVATLVSNPLQMIERDVIFRRWSDTVRATFLVTLGGDTDKLDVRQAGRDASEQFSAMASCYASLLGKSRAAKPATTKASGATTATVAGLSLTNPGQQNSTLGVALASPLQVVFTGPSETVLECGALPPGIELNHETSSFEGTPSKVGKYRVTIIGRAANGSIEEVTATFEWTVSKKSS